MMKKPIRRILIVGISFATIFIIGIIVANSIIKNKIENYIHSGMPNHLNAKYASLDLSILSRTITVSNPSFSIKNKQDSLFHTVIEAENVSFSGVGFWNYVINKKIHLEEITIEKPRIQYFKSRHRYSDSVSGKNPRGELDLLIDRFRIRGAQLTVYDQSKDSLLATGDNLNLEVTGIKSDGEIIHREIPFVYEKAEARGDSLFVRANQYDNLTVGDFSYKNNNVTLTDVHYYTKFSRSEYSVILEKERDHYDISVNDISIKDFNFGFKGGEFFAKTPLLALNTPSAIIYRDKLLPDTRTIKPLYSRSLRELPFDLTVDSLLAVNGYLKYQERVEAENMGGFVDFKNLDLKGSNLSNTYTAPEKTEVHIEALFMKKSPMSVAWHFDVQDTTDAFVFQARVNDLDAPRMNNFTEPNLNVRLQGTAQRTYFTIHGNDDKAHIDMRMKYSDFKVDLLKKKSKKKKGLFSAIINIFISKDSKEIESNFREGSADATREKTKSVFNLLWISIEGALEDIMI